MDRKAAQLQALDRLEQRALEDAKKRARPRPFLVTLSVPARLLVATEEGEETITDPAVLRRLNGVREDADMVDAIFPGDPLAEMSLSGGDLELRYEGAGGLRVETRYRAPEAPAEKQLAALIHFTRGQWSDGAGEGLSYDLPDDISGAVAIDWDGEVSTSIAEVPLTAEETKRLEDELERAKEGITARIQASKDRILDSK